MNIRFRTLLVFGGGLWVSLILTDFFYKNAKTQVHGLETSEETKLTVLVDKLFGTSFATRIKKSPKEKMTEEIFEEPSTFNFGWSLLFWNLVAFVFSVVTCVLLKNVLTYGAALYNKYKSRPAIITFAPPNTKYIDTKHPDAVPKIEQIDNDISEKEIMSREYSNITTTDSKEPLSSRTGFSTSGIKVAGFERHMEHECARLREEMIAMQSASIHENDLLSKKLDAMVKEKRDLAKQLSNAQKENRVARRHLEDVVMERDLLLKRLDCANKEFKLKSRSNRNVMEQLEESRMQIETLKKQVTDYAEEKNKIEKRIEILDKEYSRISDTQDKTRTRKEEPNVQGHKHAGDDNVAVTRDWPKVLEGSDANRMQMSSPSSEAEINEHKYSSADAITEKNSSYIEDSADIISEIKPEPMSQKELDMRKIHIKLMKLEESLEALRKRKLALKQREKEEEEQRLITLKEENMERESAVEKLKEEMAKFQRSTITTATEMSSMNIVTQFPKLVQQTQTQPVIIVPVKHSPACPLSNIAPMSVKVPTVNTMGNLTDEQREKIFGPDKVMIPEKNVSSTSNVATSDSSVDSSSTDEDDHRERGADEEDNDEEDREDFTSATYSTMSSDDSERGGALPQSFNIASGLVSHSPAFQKFLETFNAMRFRNNSPSHHHHPHKNRKSQYSFYH